MLIDTVKKEGDALVQSIQEGQKRKKLSASGRTAATLRLDVTDSKNHIRLRILGSRVFLILQNGRKPNRSGKPGREQIAGLTEWVKLKGIPLAAVWPIAINQAKNGTQVPNKNNPGGILSDPLSQANLQRRLLPALRSTARDDVRTQLFAR